MQDIKAFWKSTVSVAPGSAGLGTTMTVNVSSAIGTPPTVPFYAVVRRPGSTNGDPDNATATIVKVTAMDTGTGVISAMTRDQGGASSFAILVGDEVYQSLYHVLVDMDIPFAPTAAGIQAAITAYPGRTIKWPENLPYTMPSATPIDITTAFGKGKIIVPRSSPFTPVAGSAAQSIFRALGTLDAGRAITSTTVGSRNVPMANTSGLAAGQSIYLALTTFNTWFRSRIKSVDPGVKVVLYDALCRTASSGTLYVVTPMLADFDLHGDGTGNTNTSTRLLQTYLTEESHITVLGSSFSGALVRHDAGYNDELHFHPESSGNGGGVDYGDIYSTLGSTNCQYFGRTYRAAGNGYYLSHCHRYKLDVMSRGGGSRGVHTAACCGFANVDISGSTTYGLMVSDRCHNTHIIGHIEDCDGYGLVLDDAAGDYQESISFNGTVERNGVANSELDIYARGGRFGSLLNVFNNNVTFTDTKGIVNAPVYTSIGYIDANFTTDVGSFTTVTAFVYYKMQGDTIHMKVVVTAGTAGTTPGEIRVELPFSRTARINHPTVLCSGTNNGTLRNLLAYSNDGDAFIRVVRQDGVAFANGTTIFTFDIAIELDPVA